MKAYPAYKASGIEWLGEIPAHWNLQKLKYTAIINPTKNHSHLANAPDNLVTFLPMEKVKEDGTFVVDTQKPLKELWNGFTYFEENDVIVAKITPCFENGKGALLKNLGSKIGFGSTEFHVLREKVNSSFAKYLYYLTKSHLFRKMGEALMTGAAGQKRVPTSFLEEFSIGFPPLPEQRAIVAYLDHKTRLIDTYIAKKQQQVERWQAYRAALINQAVTKGLNPAAPMKASGIAWLGDIPAHWEVKKLKYAAIVNPTKDHSYFLNDPDQLVTFLPMERVNENGSFVSDLKKTLAEVWNGFTYFEENDVIVAKITPCFENGKGALLKNLGSKIGFGSTEFHVLREKSNYSISKYLYYLTKTYLFRKMGEALMTGAAGQKRVPTSFIEDFIIGFPPLSEQCAIAAYLDEQTAKIDTLVAATQRQLERLHTYRTALISEVVTGKIDVRNSSDCS